MKTVLFNTTGNAIDDQTITEVTRIEFENDKAIVHSAKDGIHTIELGHVRRVD